MWPGEHLRNSGGKTSLPSFTAGGSCTKNQPQQQRKRTLWKSTTQLNARPATADSKRTKNKAFSKGQMFLISKGCCGTETLNDKDEWMLTQLRHCNVGIAAERVLLLLYTVSNARVMAGVSLLKDHSVLAAETPGLILTLPHSWQANTHSIESKLSSHFWEKKICYLWLITRQWEKENVHVRNTEKASCQNRYNH